MRVDGNHGSTLGYEPNSYGEWHEQKDYSETPSSIEGTAAHWNHREDNDDYFSQVANLFKLMSTEQQKTLFENTSRAMGDAPRDIKVRHIGNCLKADLAYGEGVAKAMDISMDEIPR
jgi:catalase